MSNGYRVAIVYLSVFSRFALDRHYDRLSEKDVRSSAHYDLNFLLNFPP